MKRENLCGLFGATAAVLLCAKWNPAIAVAEEVRQIGEKVQEPTEFFWFGVAAWSVIGIVLLILCIVLLCHKSSGRGKMTGARYSALRRENRKHPKRLLNSKYYDGIPPKN